MKITVLLADDHTVVREGLKLLINSSEDVEVVGEVENGEQAVQMARKLRPDVILLDLVMPVLNGIEAVRRIKREVPTTRILVLSSYSDDEQVQRLVEDGATGYLIKQTAANELLKGIREVKKGNAYFSPSISKRLLGQFPDSSLRRGTAINKKITTLTAREAEVLKLIAERFANKQIASELSISIKTVEKHRQQVMNKLNIHEVAGLTRHAVSKGIIDANDPPSSL